MNLYKIYKEDCPPCKTMTKLLGLIEISEGINIIPIDAKNENNKWFIDKHSIKITPTLLFENGLKLEGVKRKEILQKFIENKGENYT